MSRRNPLLTSALLVGLPLWLAVSAGIGLWLHFKKEKERELAQESRFARAVSIPSLKDDLTKFVEIIGERHASTESAASNLSRAASMIEGLLGSSNMGYTVNRLRGPANWPMLHVTLPGSDPSSPPVWVLAAYDSRPGSKGADLNASGLAATLATAQAMANSKNPSPVHFLFIPHTHDPDSPVIETIQLARQSIAKQGPPHSVLCVETMGSGERLWLTSRDTEAKSLPLIQGLGEVVGAEVACLADDTDLASLLFETGLPTARVATGPIPPADAKDDRTPFAPTVAASTGRLLELVQRCAGTHSSRN